jgi:hypothetical protein
MSVSQVKKRFAEMESYLGRDKEALRRLKLLKDDVNVLRTSLAAAEEKAAEAEVVKEAARKRADDAQEAASIAKQDLESTLSRISAIECTVTVLRDQLKQATEEKDSRKAEPADEESAIKQMMRDLIKVSEYCPVSPRNGGKIPADTMWFNRTDFCSGWSRKDIWTLGASVAALVFMNGQIVLYTDHTAGVMKKKHRLGSFVAPIVRWIKKNIRPDGVDELWDSLSEDRKEQGEQTGRMEDTGIALFGRKI